MTSEPISWPQLMVLMAFGDGTEDHIAGVIEVRDVVQVDDDDDVMDGVAVTQHPSLGRVRVIDDRIRASRRGDLVRTENAAGEPRMILGADTTWVWLDEDETPTAFPRNMSAFGWFGSDLLDRQPLSRWEGNDFTTLTGPIEAVQFLGRPAWTFDLAPPPHKPYPLQMVVDAATGLVLRHASAGFDSVTEWTSLDVGAGLPDELFAWDRPTLPPPDSQAEHEHDMAQRRSWLAERGIADVSLVFEPELMPHERDDETGSFYASLEVMVHASLARRPLTVADTPWPVVDGSNWDFEYRWSDEQWDWYLGSTTAFGDDQIASLRRQLGDTR